MDIEELIYKALNTHRNVLEKKLELNKYLEQDTTKIENEIIETYQAISIMELSDMQIITREMEE